MVMSVHVENHCTQKINLGQKNKSDRGIIWETACPNFPNQTLLVSILIQRLAKYNTHCWSGKLSDHVIFQNVSREPKLWCFLLWNCLLVWKAPARLSGSLSCASIFPCFQLLTPTWLLVSDGSFRSLWPSTHNYSLKTSQGSWITSFKSHTVCQLFHNCLTNRHMFFSQANKQNLWFLFFATFKI